MANLLLDDLDKELERRGRWFCRYADDSNIYVRTITAGERVMASITRFLEKKLHLRVNRKKSAVALVWQRKYLGYRILRGKKLRIAPKSLKYVKDRIRQITRRNLPVSFDERVNRLNSFLSGWVVYFQLADCRSHLSKPDEWVRRKLRCVHLKQRKRAKAIAEFLQKCGVWESASWQLAASGKGWWRLSDTPQAHHAMSRICFEQQGLVSLIGRYTSLEAKGNHCDT